MARILLVEDNALNRDMLSRRLSRRGHDVLIAEDGERGVMLARARRPDVILMDLGLPGIDGFEATRQIKHTPELRGVPVIALTAHAMSDDRARALQAGCDAFHTKPVDIEVLLAEIAAQLGVSGSRLDTATAGSDAPRTHGR